MVEVVVAIGGGLRRRIRKDLNGQCERMAPDRPTAAADRPSDQPTAAAGRPTVRPTDRAPLPTDRLSDRPAAAADGPEPKVSPLGPPFNTAFYRVQKGAWPTKKCPFFFERRGEGGGGGGERERME